jgi:sugar phosphate isomerase/epimerase
MRVGLMLYSVRDDCARDFEGTLRAVAELGYEGVELFDLHGHDASRVRSWLSELALEACARHASLEALESRLPELADEARALGWRRVAVSWLPPESLSDPDLPRRLHHVALEARRAGLELGFHNHDAEFLTLPNGRTFFDLLPSDLFLELDLGWAWYAGVDPAALLGRTRGRCPLVHVKDFRSREGRQFCPVGDGEVGYERIVPLLGESGVEWLLVEQDETERSALGDAERSLHAVRSMLRVAA